MLNKIFLSMLIISIVSIICVSATTANAQECNDTGYKGLEMRIHDIQGAAHDSPLAGCNVANISGIVTAIDSNGFYIQDKESDLDNATSEGMYVFTHSTPLVKISNSVKVSGIVSEYKIGNSLGLTEIKNPTIYVESANQSLPVAVIIGVAGRSPPNMVIDDDKLTEFDANNDGIDFYESLEGMLVQINDALVLAPPKDNVIFVLADNGTSASIRSSRGGILLRPGDTNPERIAIRYKKGPKYINTGDQLKGPIVGVLTYNPRNCLYQIEIDALKTNPGNLIPERAVNEVLNGGLSLATFNVENLYPNDPKMENLSHKIVYNLSLPDIIALEELGDNNGKANDSIVAANETYEILMKAIKDESGVQYDYANIDPLDDQDGGARGFNIRVGILYRPDKGLQLVQSVVGNAENATIITTDDQGKPHLSLNPGRIDPMNPAFNNNRKPLATEFEYNGSNLFVIANHLKSKNEDQEPYGANQPPDRMTENQRHKQAQVIRTFVNMILNADPNANVVVLGDLNDFQFSETLNILKGGDLYNAIESLKPEEQYTYIHEGNSQVLDHILMSRNLSDAGFAVDVVHINSEFANRTSDHDPVLLNIFSLRQ